MNSTLQAVPKALYHETVLKKHRNNIALNTIATLFASLSDIEPCQVDGLRNSQEKKMGFNFVQFTFGRESEPFHCHLVWLSGYRIPFLSPARSAQTERSAFHPAMNQRPVLTRRRINWPPTRNKNFSGYPVTEGFQIHHQLKLRHSTAPPSPPPRMKLKESNPEAKSPRKTELF